MTSYASPAKEGGTKTVTPIDLMTLCELAKTLRVHENTARRLIAKGKFPNSFKIERDWRIPLGDVHA